MPRFIAEHALVAINKTCSLLIGGRTNGLESATVYYFEHEGKNWSQGPDLMQPRGSHAAGLVTDETTYDEFVIVTGGEYNGIKLDSTEILIDNQWHLGKITHDCSIRKNYFASTFVHTYLPAFKDGQKKYMYRTRTIISHS